jgi:hypothetical protein
MRNARMICSTCASKRRRRIPCSTCWPERERYAIQCQAFRDWGRSVVEGGASSGGWQLVNVLKNLGWPTVCGFVSGKRWVSPPFPFRLRFLLRSFHSITGSLWRSQFILFSAAQPNSFCLTRGAALETYAFGMLQIGNDLKQIARLRVATGSEHAPDSKSPPGARQEH